MARHKKFHGGTKISEFEPLTFELNGSEFTCNPAIPGAALLNFVKDADGDSGGDSAKALFNFLKAAMPVDEYKRLDEVLNAPDVIIDIELIGEIVSWLVEEFSSRPTTRPEVSSNGQQTSGRSSTEEPFSPVFD